MGGVIAPKAREKLEAKLKGGWVCLKNVNFVIHSTDSVLALGPQKTGVKKSQWGCRTDTSKFP